MKHVETSILEVKQTQWTSRVQYSTVQVLLYNTHALDALGSDGQQFEELWLFNRMLRPMCRTVTMGDLEQDRP